MPSEINPEYPINAQPPETLAGDHYQDGYDYYMKIKELEKSSFKDLLTGCYNRNAWEDFEKHFDIGRGDKATIIMIDLNCLKKINDNQGHSFGDEYIKSTVSYLQEVFSRASDQIYRIGGDELVVACNFVVPEKREDFNSYIASRFNYDLLEQKSLDFAFGVAHTDIKQDASLQDTLKRADTAMYKNKKNIKTTHPSKYLP